mmetsp:Transcript_3803/g.10819  ORF Transcript_3803/g.10819 Transcript_3803/m.10819 type:complete len:223 (-) Transcript_3803:364-1032(-)
MHFASLSVARPLRCLCRWLTSAAAAVVVQLLASLCGRRGIHTSAVAAVAAADGAVAAATVAVATALRSGEASDGAAECWTLADTRWPDDARRLRGSKRCRRLRLGRRAWHRGVVLHGAAGLSGRTAMCACSRGSAAPEERVWTSHTYRVWTSHSNWVWTSYTQWLWASKRHSGGACGAAWTSVRPRRTVTRRVCRAARWSHDQEGCLKAAFGWLLIADLCRS